MDLLVVVAAALSILPTPLAPIALPPATSSSCCSDNSVGITSFTSCIASFSIFSIFLLSSLMVFLLFEMFSFVNSRGAVEASQINCLHPIRCKPTKNGAIIVSLVSRVYTPRIPTTGALQRFREAAASKAFVGQIVNLRPIGNRPAESEHAFTALRRRRIVGRPAAETDDRRAIASRPRILLFDEATSALDNQTQAIVDRKSVV